MGKGDSLQSTENGDKGDTHADDPASRVEEHLRKLSDRYPLIASWLKNVFRVKFFKAVIIILLTIFLPFAYVAGQIVSELDSFRSDIRALTDAARDTENVLEELRVDLTGVDSSLAEISTNVSNQRVDSNAIAVLNAWRIVNSASGKAGNGGRRQALEVLHRHGEDLVAVDLRGIERFFTSPDGRQQFNVQGAVLTDVELENVNLSYAKANGIVFVRAKLRGANFNESELAVSNFSEADLVGANLGSALLQNAVFFDADLAGTKFHKAHLEGADLSNAKNLLREQVSQAYVDEATVLPQGWSLEEIKAIQIRTGYPPQPESE